MPSDARILVTGRASREITPDIARWTFDVTATGDDEAAALSACVERTGAVLVALREAFGDDVTVSTGTTSLHEAYDDEPDYEEPPTARASVSAKLPADLAGRAAPVAVGAGASGAHGPQWELAAAEAVREELLDEAFATARRKAERLAGAAGGTLGDVVEVREGGASWDEGDVAIVGGAVDGDLLPHMGGGEATPSLSAMVSVVFGLRAAEPAATPS
jgi:hypothetical protein